jgi:hypothetical protein
MMPTKSFIATTIDIDTEADVDVETVGPSSVR